MPFTKADKEELQSLFVEIRKKSERAALLIESLEDEELETEEAVDIYQDLESTGECAEKGQEWLKTQEARE
jgi:hypothetical protein